MQKRLFVLSLVILTSILSNKTYSQQGFFLDNWENKDIVSPTSFTDAALTAKPATATVRINFADTITKVSKYVYGNNANIYTGTMSNEPALVKNIKNLNPHVLRWPGGNLSNVFFWDKQKNERPADIPSVGIDPWYGKNNESWTMSIDSFYSLCKQTNAEPIICINYSYARYGTGTNPVTNAAHYAANWVRYDKGRTKFWELGNENFGNWQAGYKIDLTQNKDGQPEYISGSLYGQHCRIFIDSMRKAAAEIGSNIKIGVNGLESLVTWDEIQKNWNSGLISQVGDKPDYFIVHSYYTPYNENSTAETILNSYTKTEEFNDFVWNELTKQGKNKLPIALTEWNIFAVGSKQSVSYISGMHASLVLGKLIQEKYGLATRWDLANGWDNGNDHGMFSMGDEGTDIVEKRTPHPVFYYMYYFQKYFGDVMVNNTVTGNSNVIAYASRFHSRQAGVVLINKSRSPQVANLILDNFTAGDRFYTYTLTGGTDNGDFSRKVYVNGETSTQIAGGPAFYDILYPRSTSVGSEIKVEMPALSVVYMLIDKGSRIINTTQEIDRSTSLEISPNPATNYFSITNLPENSDWVEIMDLKGTSFLKEKVNPESNNSQFLHFNLPAGCYIVKLKSNSSVYTCKLMVTQ